MRILALTNLYPNPLQPHRAPFNRHWLRLLAMRHAVRVISPIAWTDEAIARRRGSPPLPRSRQVELDGLIVDHPRFWFTPRFGRRWYGHFYRASVRRTFERVVDELRPELIYAPWAYPDGWAAVRLAAERGLPVVLQVHGSDVLLLDDCPARKGGTIEAIRGADGIVAVSHHIAGRLRSLGTDPERVRVIHDGVDPAVFHPGSKREARAKLGLADDTPALLFIGNLVPVKGIAVLIEAIAQLKDEEPCLRLHIVGQGPLRADLERRARQAGLGDRVSFTGALPQTQLPDWYRAADCLVLPSHSEGVPNVLLEASACGTPWVASDVGGIPEIAVDGRCRLVAPNAPSALARAIRDTLAAPPRGAAPPPKLRTDAVAELESFLEAVLARRAGTRSSPLALEAST